MIRLKAIALTAVAVMLGAALAGSSALARGMGGGMGGGMSHGSMGGGMSHPGGFAHFNNGPGFAFHSPAMHLTMFHGNHLAFRHDFRFHHRFFFGPTFAFVGAPYGYDDCYERVWTRWGWQWVSVCY